jgi:CHAT domain-containing protein
LSDDYVLFTLPSASVLRFIQEKRKPEADTLLALGNPTIAEPLPALRFAGQEVEAIADLYGTQPMVGVEAIESMVWSQAGKEGMLHLAAHGGYNPINPLFSAIHLAGDAQHDGRLEVHEVYGLDLTEATDLVVLSACQTQIGELSAGDEVVGLNRAFLYAGTPSVMASLWHVDDAATALLMEHFYTHLRAGLGKAEALRQAQVDVRAEYPHPYYWAAFVLTGDAGEVTGAPVDETPRAEETPAPAKGDGGPCPAGALILALGVGVALIATGRGTRYERHHLSGVADQG